MSIIVALLRSDASSTARATCELASKIVSMISV
jgi:hypothetical protein